MLDHAALMAKAEGYAEYHAALMYPVGTQEYKDCKERMQQREYMRMVTPPSPRKCSCICEKCGGVR